MFRKSFKVWYQNKSFRLILPYEWRKCRTRGSCFDLVDFILLRAHFVMSVGGKRSSNDADWGSNPIDRKSYSGYVIFMANGPVAWEAKKQNSISLSSMEAEYIAMCQRTREVIFMRNVLREIGLQNLSNKPTLIRCDNQGAECLVKNPTTHKRSKHIDIKYHYIREKFEANEISIEYVQTTENVADLLTKSLTKEKHKKCCKMLNLYK